MSELIKTNEWIMIKFFYRKEPQVILIESIRQKVQSQIQIQIFLKLNYNLQMNINNQDLQAFLIEAQLINQKVKALAENKISTEQFDNYAQQRAQDKQRREEAKIRKQKQAYQAKLNGRDGKGIGKDFSNFCRFCHKEYQLQTPTCFKCNRPTMTLEQRQKQLEIMVQDYKYNKKTRQEKRHKWQMFQKTQSALWKKSSIDYNKKWEYFVEDSDEQPQKQPIVPKNDPNFKALEMDIQQRKKRRLKDTENAKRLKQKGNNQMKVGNYQKAIQFYTLALQHIKDIKSIYTNRALAYIKLRKFKRAIKDCTNVIEFMEVFEKIGENKDLAFKAFSRRAQAKKQIKQYKQALNDINEALKLIPTDKNAAQLRRQIQGFIKHSETVEKLVKQSNKKQQEKQKEHEVVEQEQQEDRKQNSQKIQQDIIKQLAQSQLRQQEKKNEAIKAQKTNVTKEEQKQQNPIKQIPKRISNLTDQNVEYIFKLLIKNQQLKSIFIASKGIESLLEKLFKQQSNKQEALLICLCLDNSGVAQRKVWEWGISKFYEKIQGIFSDESKLNQSKYDFVDSLFEILVPITLYNPCKADLAKWGKTHQFVTKMFSSLITKFKKQPSLVDNFFVFLSNLCEGDSMLKNSYIKKQQFIVMIQALFVRIFDQGRSKNRKILDLRQSVFNLIANIITNIENRKAFVEYLFKNNNDRASFLKNEIQGYPRYAHNFDAYIESILSVLVNATLETDFQMNELADVIFERFIAHRENFNETIIFRGLLVLARLKYDSSKSLSKWMDVFDKFAIKQDPLANPQQKNMVQIIKILNVLFDLQKSESQKPIPPNLFKALTKYIKQNLVHQNLFCNTCNLFGIVLSINSGVKQQVLEVLRQSMGQLVLIAKEKTGNWRKSAAILIAKSSGDPRCRAQMDKHHGMDVLKSIAQFVTEKK